MAFVRPVEQLSKGAQSFAIDTQTDPLPEAGPQEVRTAIRSFNVMQDKLRTLIDERGQTLASISHDLRTPLTRMRLRLEQVELYDAAEGVERDLTAMEAMIDDALDFLRSENHRVDKVMVDIRSLCETVVNDFVDQGARVRLSGQGGAEVACDILLTVRALTNLIENAVKYAGPVLVELRHDGHEIAVTDCGPGIPPDRLARVTKPFNRVETVSSGQLDGPPGFGLGLAIADVNMSRQGGSLILEPNVPTGLIARLILR